MSDVLFLKKASPVTCGKVRPTWRPKRQFDLNNLIFVPAVKLLQFLIIKTLDPDPDSVPHLWIRNTKIIALGKGEEVWSKKRVHMTKEYQQET